METEYIKHIQKLRKKLGPEGIEAREHLGKKFEEKFAPLIKFKNGDPAILKTVWDQNLRVPEEGHALFFLGIHKKCIYKDDYQFDLDDFLFATLYLQG